MEKERWSCRPRLLEVHCALQGQALQMAAPALYSTHLAPGTLSEMAREIVLVGKDSDRVQHRK